MNKYWGLMQVSYTFNPLTALTPTLNWLVLAGGATLHVGLQRTLRGGSITDIPGLLYISTTNSG